MSSSPTTWSARIADGSLRLVASYPQCHFSVTADHPVAIEALSKAMLAEGQRIEVLLDIDVGQHRTGVPAGPAAVALYQKIQCSPGLAAGGLHVYDGHNHADAYPERAAAALASLHPVLEMRGAIEAKGVPVPRIIAGGTPSFPAWIHLDVPNLECSPGTFVLHDSGYGARYADLSGFKPAALLLTCVISRPTPIRVTFDLGYKAVASDPPAGKSPGVARSA